MRGAAVLGAASLTAHSREWAAVRSGMVGRGRAWRGMASHTVHSTECIAVRSGVARQNMARFGMAVLGKHTAYWKQWVEVCSAWYGVAVPGVARHGVATNTGEQSPAAFKI